MEITASMYLIVLPMIFLAALVDSISGGGGLISMPAYTMAGLSYDFAAGNNKFSSTFGTLTATIRYYRSGKLKMLPALWAIAGALPGAWLGTQVSLWLGNEFMHIFMVVAIPVVGLFVVFRKNDAAVSREMVRRDYIMCLVIGLGVGFYDGMFGPGTGTFLILLFNWVAGMDMVTASATSKPVNLASNIASLITRIAAGNVLYALAIPAMCCSIAGGAIGSKLALMKGAKFVRYVMLGVLALMTVKLVVELVMGTA